MQERSWTYLDRSKWLQGDWAGEPDKKQWQDKATGLPCLIVRNRSGALCGYVGVSEGHPYFERGYNDCDVNVHGGLTFSDFCQPYGENGEQGICHVVGEGENERVWWLGLDCAHSGDVLPAYDWSNEWQCSYKNIYYVQNEVTCMAAQLEAALKTPEAGRGDSVVSTERVLQEN